MTCYSNHDDNDKNDHDSIHDSNDDVASIITAHSSQDVALDKVWTHVSHHHGYNNNNNSEQDPTLSSLDSDNNNGSSDEVEEIVFVSDDDDDDDEDEQPVEEEEGEEVFMDPVGDMGLGGERLLFKTTTKTTNNNNNNKDEEPKTLFPPSRVFRSGRYRTKENSVSLNGVLERKANNSMDPPRVETTTTTTTMFAWRRRQDDFVHPAIPNEIMLNLSEEEEVLPTKGGGPPSRATTETGTASSYSISPTNSRGEESTTNNFIPRKKFALYSSYLQKSSPQQQMILVDHITPDSSVQSLDQASKSEMESSCCSDEFDTPVVVVKSSSTKTSDHHHQDGAFPYHNVNNYDDDDDNDEEKVLVQGGVESLRNAGSSDTSASAATTPAETTPQETVRRKRRKKKKKKKQQKTKGWEKFAGRIGMKATFCLVVFIIFLVCLLMVVGIVVLGQHVEFSLNGISPEELGPTPQPTWRFPTPAPQPLPTTPSPVVVATAPSPTPPPNLRGNTPSPTVAATTTTGGGGGGTSPLWSHTGLIMRRPFNFTALSLSDNGRVMAVTAENTTVSRVRVWQRHADNGSNNNNNNGWMPMGQPLDEIRLVAVGGAPGAPATSLYRRSSALSKDGTRLCILTLRQENAKIQGTLQVYNFVNATSLWSLEETLNPKASRDTDMVLSGNGETIVVTNVDDNKQPVVVYGLETDKMKWKEQKPAVAGIGQGSVVTKVSISHNGTVLAVQHNTAAATIVMIRVLRFDQAAGWVALGQDVSTTQGGLMALSSSDGTTLAVAANTTSSSSSSLATTMNGITNNNVDDDDGSAMVYRYSSDTDLWQVQSHDSISGSGDLLSAMSLSANGNVLATVATSSATTNGTSSSSLPILVHSFAVAQSRWTRMGSGLHHVGLPTRGDFVHLVLSGDGRSIALATTGGIQTWEQS